MSQEYNRYLAARFFANLEAYGGVLNGQAVLFVYNRKAPELSYITVENL